jgi:DNA-binding transcriptional regulator YdaS (Cro superfamily)
MRKDRKTRERHPVLAKCVDLVGGIEKLAKSLDCDNSSVCRWVYMKHKVPAKYVKKIVALSEGLIKPEELRPDIFY